MLTVPAWLPNTDVCDSGVEAGNGSDEVGIANGLLSAVGGVIVSALVVVGTASTKFVVSGITATGGSSGVGWLITSGCC